MLPFISSVVLVKLSIYTLINIYSSLYSGNDQTFSYFLDNNWKFITHLNDRAPIETMMIVYAHQSSGTLSLKHHHKF